MSLRTLLPFALSFASLTAVAGELVGQAPEDAGQPARPRSVQLTLGGGIMLRPKYDGSNETVTRPLPLATAEIAGKVFIGPGVAGVYLARAGGFTSSLGVALVPSRSDDYADALAGMDRRGLGAFSVSAVTYHSGWVDLGVTGRRSLGEHGGYAAQVQAGVTLPVGRRFGFGLAASVSFADRKNMAYDFGVTQSEASRRAGLMARGDRRLRADEARAYRPAGGLRSFGAGTSLGFQVTPHWALVALVDVSRLGNEAARSPLVRRRDGVSGGLGVTFTPLTGMGEAVSGPGLLQAGHCVRAGGRGPRARVSYSPVFVTAGDGTGGNGSCIFQSAGCCFSSSTWRSRC